jgi:hypothetical protein
MKVTDYNRIPALIRALPRGIIRGLEELEDGTLEQIDEGFASGQNAMGEDWKPLAPQTIKLKGHDRILRDTEELRNSFEGSVNREQYQLEIAVDNWKAPIHEFGVPDENIPKRAMVRPAARWVETEGIDKHFESALQETTTTTLVTTRGV